MLRPGKVGGDITFISTGTSSPSSSPRNSPRSRRQKLRSRKPTSSSLSSITNVATIVIGTVLIMYLLLFHVAHHRLKHDTFTSGVRGGGSSSSSSGGEYHGKTELLSLDSVDSALQYRPKLLPPEPYKPPKKSLFNKRVSRQFEKREKKTGKIVYKPITAFHKEDIGSLVSPNATSTMPYDEAIKGRERLVDIIHDAGVEEIDVEVIASLPKWDDVTKLYGGDTGPVIIGLERCEEFRRNIPLDDASMGTAGMFNTGTNPFAMYLENNCIMPHNTKDRAGGTRWQVPWGKHMLASRKWNNTAKRDERVNKTNVMPIVLVRDPYSWMQSMCKNPYEAKWDHKTRCPNLINVETHKPNPLKVIHYNPETWFDSLAHFWARWYHEYVEADYPRLIVRFEDLHFHAKELIDTICQCAGGTARNPEGDFQYIVDNAKWGAAHTKTKTNMVTAMIKYGSDKNRFKGMSEEDMDFAASVFTPEWMNLFKYEMPKKQKEAWLAGQKSGI